MKKTIATIMIMVVIFIVGFVSGIGFLKNHIYSRNGIVTEVNKEEDTVTWFDGYFDWVITDADDWHEGDSITVINFDMMTDDITDDYTIEYRYTDM